MESNAILAKTGAGKVAALPARLKDYWQDLKAEMRRVTWPSWKQVRATTLVVLAAVFLFAGYFAVVDAIMGRGINRVFQIFTR